LDECGDGRFVGFDGWLVIEVAESFAGDGTDRGERDRGRKSQVGSFEESTEVSGCRSTGEGDGVGIIFA
jgi:hypothetical protein